MNYDLAKKYPPIPAGILEYGSGTGNRTPV